MIQEELFSLISRFAQRPLPALTGRHVYLWHGSWETLKEAIPAEILVSIDLHHLATTLPRAPRARDEAARLLRQAIEKALQERLKPNSQQIVAVTGCDLLSRYQLPLIPFFQLASEKTMLILVVSPAETHFQPSSPLPNYVKLHPAAPLVYLQTAVGPAATINTDSETRSS